MNREYHQLIFTKHALERLELRSISPDAVERVLARPDRTHPSDKPNSTKFIRELDGRVIHVVATYLRDQNKWLIVSVWVRGEEDRLPLAWQILTAPFKLIWWFLQQVWKVFQTPPR